MGLTRNLHRNYLGLGGSTQPAVILVMVILVKMILSCQNPPLYINILFIYSEQWHIRKWKWPFWPWPLWPHFGNVSCRKINGLKSQPVEYQDQLLYVRSTSVPGPFLRICEKWELHRNYLGTCRMHPTCGHFGHGHFGQNDFELSKSSTIYKYSIYI